MKNNELCICKYIKCDCKNVSKNGKISYKKQ